MRAATRLGLLKTAALGLALSVGAFGTASASPSPINFTWDPSATGDTTAGTFTADRFGINDWATISVPSDPTTPGSISESGFLEISGFTLAGASVSTVHTSGKGTSTPLSGYGIYESFSTTSDLPNSSSCTTPTTPNCTILTGSFQSVTANVYLYSTANGLASYSFPGTVATIKLPKNAHPVLLATESGPIGSSPNTTSITITRNSKGNITSEIPGASVDSLWTDVFAPGFFISPPADILLDLEQAFTNTSGVIKATGAGCSTTGTNCTYEIQGGGGNGNFYGVPEPASLAVLGFGLVALGITRRRRSV